MEKRDRGAIYVERAAQSERVGCERQNAEIAMKQTGPYFIFFFQKIDNRINSWESYASEFLGCYLLGLNGAELLMSLQAHNSGQKLSERNTSQGSLSTVQDI